MYDVDGVPEVSDPSEILEIFKHNTIKLMTARNLSRSELSRRAGYKNTNKVTTVLNGNSLPNISVAMNFARALEVPVGALFKHRTSQNTSVEIQAVQDINDEATKLLNAVFQAAHKKMVDFGERPSIDAVTAWWQESGGRLESCDQLMPHFDVVSVPGADQKIPDVLHVGESSLTSRALHSTDSHRMKSFLKTLNEADQEELKRCIRSVSYTGTGLVTPQTRVVDMPGTGSPMEISFIRLMLPVTDSAGRPHVLNFSTLVSESTLKRNSGLLQ